MREKYEIFADLCNEAQTTYKAKNHDYGDSFAKVRAKLPNSVLIRLNDKLSRLEVLMSGAVAQVKDESIDDTLIDLANYALMELTERIYEREQEEAKKCAPKDTAPDELYRTIVGSLVCKNLEATAGDGIGMRTTEEGLLVFKVPRPSSLDELIKDDILDECSVKPNNEDGESL